MNTCSVILQSGLGNILFKIAASYAYAKRYNKNFKIYRSLCDDSPHSPFDLYINTIFSKIKFSNENPQNLPVFKESAMLYREVPNINEDFYFYGDFQSEKYFLDYKDEIIDLFTTNLIPFNGSGYCSIHVRRGDYLSSSHFYEQLEYDYYKTAYNLMPPNTKFLVFSNDIEWCKKNFTKDMGFENIEFADNNANYIDLELMSKCDHNIIANSTFSWWGAYLNKNPNKIIITPKQWITQHLANLSCEGNNAQYMEDLLLKEWIKI
jgi:hypothetical protein